MLLRLRLKLPEIPPISFGFVRLHYFALIDVFLLSIWATACGVFVPSSQGATAGPAHLREVRVRRGNSPDHGAGHNCVDSPVLVVVGVVVIAVAILVAFVVPYATDTGYVVIVGLVGAGVGTPLFAQPYNTPPH